MGAAWALVVEMHLRIRRHAVLISKTVRSPATHDAPVIGNPYDSDLFRQPVIAAEPGTIIFSGRVNRGKGIFHLVEAVRLLRLRGVPLKVTFVGSGPDDMEVRDVIASAGLDECIVMVGHREPEQVAALLARHQIAAIPSVWDEPFGIVALEAIACGCYVVAFPDGGLPFAFGEAGLVTAEKSPAALANAIQCLLTDESLRRRIDENRQAQLNRFSRGTICARLLEILSAAQHRSNTPR